MAIYRGPGGSGDATDDAANAAELIIQKTDEAAAYAASASTSATNAAASAVSAAASASGVGASAAAAAASAAAALVSETNAAASASSATSSASSASSNASTATTKAAEAAASASSASSSASSASTSASNASTSASNAASSASSASSSASAASTNASNAAISESNAASSAALAAGYFPSATGNTGKYLRTNGTTNYWDTVDSLPSQASNSGKFLTTNGTTASWAAIAGATPTDDGLVYGLTDAGTYYPPATVAGAWFDNPTATSIYTNISGDYNGQTTPGNIISKASDGTIAVGKTLILELTSVATSTLVQVNAGTITNIVIEGGSYGVTITFSNSINWNDYVHTGVIFNYKLIVNSLILSGNKAENAILGYNAGNNITTGGENVIVGSGAASTLTEGRNNIIIGNAAESTTATTNNEVTLGNSSHTKTRLFGALAVGGSSTGTSGQVLTSGGSGSAPSWSTFNALPSQSGNSGKYLTTNGTDASWAAVPNPNEATVTDSGLIFGETNTTDGIWSGTLNHAANYQYQYNLGFDDKKLSFPSTSPVYAAAVAGNIIAGGVQRIKIFDGTTLHDFGYVDFFAVFATEVIIAPTLAPLGAYGWTWVTFYAANVQFIGVKGGNALLGYQAGNNAPNGNKNTILGYKAGPSIVNGSGNIIIGANADAASDVSNEAIIGSNAITTTRLYGALAVGGTSKGTSGQVLTSNGSSSAPSWTTLTAGTVTSVALTAPTGLTVAGSPVTTSGTLALSLTAGYSIPTTSSQTNWDSAYTDRLKWDGGATGLTASTGRTSLGLVIGTDIPSVSGSGATGTWGISISGNAATVTNGLYSTGSYSDPTWLTTLAGSKITGTINGGTY